MKKTITVAKSLCAVLLVAIAVCAFSFAASAVTEESLADTHIRIDWQPTAGSYWNSTSNQKISTADTPFNNQFVASGIRFTKETLPIGSYIFVDSGYKYRPEGWQNSTDKNSNTRPDYVKTACTEVTEAWWDNYTIRAFHIQSNDGSKNYVADDSNTYTCDLRANFDEAKNKFRIYVPNGTTGVEPYVELVKLNLDLTLGFYSSEGTSYKINTGTDLAKQFLATVIFTKDTLPVGSVIEVDSGYKYRPEGWTQLGVATSPRPGNVSTKKVEVTEEWWGDFNYRAFNISSDPQTDMTNKLADVKKHFRIYVPKEAAPPAFEWTLGFWDSTSGTTRSTSGDLAMCFVSSQMFTRETLPVGSVITIDSGYKYRPDGWIDLNTKNTHSTKPGNVSTASITVTEDWWGDWTYRGFNISTNAQGNISENYLEVASHFNITLPDGTKYVHPENTSADDGEDEEVPEVTVTIPDAEEGVMRILSIGNSYSNDAQHYAHRIAEGLGIKVEFYNLYYGGCTIGTHYSFYKNDSAEYVFYRNMTKYVDEKVTMKSVLEATQYDIITFQQGSYESDDYSKYVRLADLMALVRAHQPNAEFMIHQTWGYCEARACNGDETHTSGKGYETSADMFKAVEACYAQAAADNGSLRILKSGRAVETAKTEYGYTDDYGKTTSIYDDFNSHLASRGDYLAGCVWIETIFGVDVRNTTFTNNYDDADTLQEIAHKTVGNVYYASVTVGESSDFGGAPVIKTAAVDGFDYDGRARIVVQSGTEVVKTVYQNADGSMPEIELPEGTYTFKIERNGYLSYTTEALTVKVGEEYSVPKFTLIAGDIKDAGFCGDGVVDIDDFTRVLRSFADDATKEMKVICDLDCNGTVNVSDLAIVKGSFGKRS